MMAKKLSLLEAARKAASSAREKTSRENKDWFVDAVNALGTGRQMTDAQLRRLFADVAERETYAEGQIAAQLGLIESQIQREEDARKAQSTRNLWKGILTAGGAITAAALTLGTGGLALPAALPIITGAASLGHGLGGVVGGAVTGEFEPTIAGDILGGIQALSSYSLMQQLIQIQGAQTDPRMAGMTGFQQGMQRQQDLGFGFSMGGSGSQHMEMLRMMGLLAPRPTTP